MIDGFYNWVKNIAFYMVLATMVTYLMPNERYKKYLRFFTGALMVVLVIGPIISVFGAKNEFNSKFLVESLKEEVSNLKQDAAVVGDVQLDNLVAGYEGEMERQIGKIVENRNLYLVSVDVDWALDQDGAITGIEGLTVVASTKATSEMGISVGEILIDEEGVESLEEFNLKNDIEDVYNISPGNINISIQR